MLISECFCLFTSALHRSWNESLDDHQPSPSADTEGQTDAEPAKGFQFPTNLDELRALSAQLATLNRDHPLFVLAFFASAYLYKQTFAIPGSVFLVSEFHRTHSHFIVIDAHNHFIKPWPVFECTEFIGRLVVRPESRFGVVLLADHGGRLVLFLFVSCLRRTVDRLTVCQTSRFDSKKHG